MIKKENCFQNCLKGMACILVILNHFHHEGVIGEIEYTISHLGVPVFYMISGYYLWSSQHENEQDVLIKRVRHSVKLLIEFIIVVLCYQFILSIIKTHSVEYFIDLIKSRLTFNNCARSLLLSESLFGMGEWFLWAMMEAYLVFLLAYKLGAFHWIMDRAFKFALILLSIHIFVRWILIFYGIEIVLNIEILKSYCVRNVWLDAIPFMLLGYAVRTRTNCNKVIHNSYLFIITLSGLCIAIVESFLLRSFKPKVECVLYLGIVISVIALFELSVKNPNAGEYSLLEYIGRRLSSTSYFIHVEIESIVSNLMGVIGVSAFTIYRIMYPYIIIIDVLLSANIIVLIFEPRSRK